MAITVKSELYMIPPTLLVNLNYLHCVHNATLCTEINFYSRIRWYCNMYHMIDILNILHCWKASIEYSGQRNSNPVSYFRRILRDNTIRWLLYSYIYTIFQLKICTFHFAMIYATLYTTNDSIALYKSVTLARDMDWLVRALLLCLGTIHRTVIWGISTGR